MYVWLGLHTAVFILVCIAVHCCASLLLLLTDCFAKPPTPTHIHPHTALQGLSTCEGVELVWWYVVQVEVVYGGVYGGLGHRGHLTPCSTGCPLCSMGPRGHDAATGH